VKTQGASERLKYLYIGFGRKLVWECSIENKKERKNIVRELY